MSEAMDQPAGSPAKPRPGEGGDGATEPGTCQELLRRLRELEAENSALAQANENQRETYERCLDEVANHVVQALLNQKVHTVLPGGRGGLGPAGGVHQAEEEGV